MDRAHTNALHRRPMATHNSQPSSYRSSNFGIFEVPARTCMQRPGEGREGEGGIQERRGRTVCKTSSRRGDMRGTLYYPEKTQQVWRPTWCAEQENPCALCKCIPKTVSDSSVRGTAIGQTLPLARLTLLCRATSPSMFSLCDDGSAARTWRGTR